MKLLFYTAASDSAAWVEALARAIPEASIGTWPRDAAETAEYALVWKPPPELLAKLQGARAIFNLGAGVDSLESLPLSLEAVPLIRLRGRRYGRTDGRVRRACRPAPLPRVRRLRGIATCRVVAAAAAPR